MPHKSMKFLTAALASTALVISPVAVQAGQMGHFGMSGVPHVPKVQCPENVPSGHPVMNRSIVINKPVTTNIENNVNVYKPVNIEKTVNVFKPVTVSNNFEINKNIEINKPINITNNINNSKNIEINKNINNSKNIEINKNVNINKNININKSSSQSEAIAVALAQAVAAALASSSSSSSANNSLNLTLNNSSSFSANANATASANASSFSNAAAYNNSSFFSNFNVSSGIPETPGFVGSSNVEVNVSPAEVVAAPVAAQACVYQQATVIKAIHAICVSADHHEFPASHMVGDTWIRAAYEGEIARCLPGSSLKVMIGSVVQSAQGAAVSPVHGDTLICAPHEALRHFKNGLLKCASALPVPDCTERTNLRKFGTGDMFFSYVSRVCLETGQEFVGGESREVQSSYAYREQSLRGASSGY